MEISPIIEVDELLKIHTDPDVMVFDTRSGITAKADYKKEHLSNAIFVDLNGQLATLPSNYSNGGRHPLPHVSDFAKTLTALGIDKHKRLVIYDDQFGANAAARFWWMLKSIGHEKVQVLNGGLSQAKKYHFPMDYNRESVSSRSEEYLVENWKLPLKDISQVEKATLNESYLIVDVRDKERYNGAFEPIDLIAGHIPNAQNVPFTENLDHNGLFLEPDELREKYTSVFGKVKTENVIIHCGSGVTACHTLLALDYANMEIPNLYVGSWSEWSRCDQPIEKMNPSHR